MKPRHHYTVRQCVTVALATILVWQFIAWPLTKWIVGGTYRFISSYRIVNKEKADAEIAAYRDQLESLIPENVYCDTPAPKRSHFDEKTGDWVYPAMTAKEFNDWYYDELFDWSQCMKNKYHHEEMPWVQKFLDEHK